LASSISGTEKNAHGRRSNVGQSQREKRENLWGDYLLAVRAERLKACAVGAPLVPGFLILSPEPAFILACLALIFEYRPGFIGSSTF